MKGQKSGGRKPGALNKKTVEHLKTAGKQISEAKKLGKPLAIEVLDNLMNTAMAMASKYQPPTSDQPPRDHDKFLQWIQTAGLFAKNLADFQSPKFKAVMVQTSSPVGESDMTIDQEGKILEIDDPKKLARVYAQMVRRVG